MTINPYARPWRQFAEQTAEHELTILHDDGLYRHLRMAKPGTSMWSWDVITWPGHLATAGDIADGFTFARVTDMLDFFGPARPGPDGVPHISPDYWAEKLAHSQRGSERRYSEARFLAYVDETTRDAVNDEQMTEGERAHFLAEARAFAYDKHTAQQWLESDFRRVDNDWWEADLTDFDHHYLLTCFAIVTTISAYQEARS